MFVFVIFVVFLGFPSFANFNWVYLFYLEPYDVRPFFHVGLLSKSLSFLMVLFSRNGLFLHKFFLFVLSF